jgi:hypothetical protein
MVKSLIVCIYIEVCKAYCCIAEGSLWPYKKPILVHHIYMRPAFRSGEKMP